MNKRGRPPETDEGRMVVVPVRVPRSVAEWLEQAARSQMVTVSRVARHILCEYVKAQTYKA